MEQKDFGTHQTVGVAQGIPIENIHDSDDSDRVDQASLIEAVTLQKKNTSSALLLAAIETGLIITSLLLMLLLLPRNTGGDGWVRYQDLLGVVTNRTLFNAGSRYSIIGPLFSLPLLYIGRKLGDTYDWICVYNITLFSVSLLVSYVLLRKHVDRGLLRKFFLVLIIASMFAAHLALYFGEVFTALCVGLGVLVACVRFSSIAGWFVVALGVANIPVTMVGLAFMLFKKLLDSKRWRYILVLFVAGALIVTESLLRRGNLFANGYSDDHGYTTILPYSGLPGFSYPFFFGLLSILFSFGKGLIFFAPALLLPIRKTLLRWQEEHKIHLYQVYTLWIFFLLGLIFAYSRWWAWYGGAFWGPRFFLFASIPASFALAVRLLRYKEASAGVNALTFLVFCLSAWVSVDGAVFQWATTSPTVCSQNNSAMEMLCWYTPEYSVLWQPFVNHFAIIDRSQKLFLLYSLLVATYMVTPLFIYTVRQLSSHIKMYSRPYLNIKLWHF